jgi:hypothetical protein
MTDKQLSDRRLDEAIDRAVRDMMSIEPRSDLRARVIAELDGSSTRMVLWPRLAFATLALVLAVATLMTMRQKPSDHSNVPQVATSAPEPARHDEAAVRPPMPPTTDTTARKPRPGTAAQSRESKSGRAERLQPVQDRLIQAASIDTNEDGTAVAAEPAEPLGGMPPTGIANLKPITQPEIVIRPITVERIEITPLSSRR